MKKAFTLILLASLSISGIKANMAKSTDYQVLSIEDIFTEVSESDNPNYIEHAIIPSWKDNWFLNVSGGISSFIGSPIGCEDLFGRIKPVLQVGFGKWFTPSVGGRFMFQGFEWKSGELKNQSYFHYHTDFLWNVIPSFYAGDNDYRFDVIPFVGMGMIDNRTAHTKPFAVNYGVQGRYRLTDNFHITLELSNATAFKNADGIGPATQLGDNLLSLSAGVSWTFGKNVGWKKIVDPIPYIERNDLLTAYIIDRETEYDGLRKQNSSNLELLGELKKIFKIEGLLSKYSGLFDSLNGNNTGSFPSLSSSNNGKTGRAFNDYQGLKSLKERLRNAFGNNDEYDNIDNRGNNIADDFADGYSGESSTDLYDENGKSSDVDNATGSSNDINKGKKSKKRYGKNPSNKGAKGNGNKGKSGNYNLGNLRLNLSDNSGNLSDEERSLLLELLKDSLNSEQEPSYLLAMMDKKEPVGSPIFFFFELGTTDLIDDSQVVNLDEIARIASKYGLLVNIEGAADSFTGNESINSELAINRAVYVADYLFGKGISAENIYVSSVGGTDKYSPVEANRNTIITLYLK